MKEHMSHDHQHTDTIQDAMARQIASEVSRIAPYMINKAIGGALATACGALRERSYAFSPIDPTKLFADPHPINTINTDLPMGLGVLIHDRLLHMVNSYLLVVHYEGTEEHTTFTLCATHVMEEALSQAPPITFLHGVLRDEVVRQVASLPPQAPGTFRFLGLSLIEDYFKRPALESFWAPAGGIPCERTTLDKPAMSLPAVPDITDVVPVQAMPDADQVEALAAQYDQAIQETKPAAASLHPSIGLPKAALRKMSDPMVPKATDINEVAARVALANQRFASGSVPSVGLSLATSASATPQAENTLTPTPAPKPAARPGISLPAAALVKNW